MKKPKRNNDVERAKAEAVRILTEAVEKALGVLTAGERYPQKLATTLPTATDRLLTTKQAANRLGYKSIWSIYRLLKAKKITGYRLGGRTIRFDPDELDECLGRFHLKAADSNQSRKSLPTKRRLPRTAK